MASLLLFAVEDVHQGWPNEPILYRIRVLARGSVHSYPGQVIRYLAACNPPKGASGVPNYRGKLLSFDAVPAGDWNLGHLVIAGEFADDSVEDKFILASTETVQLEEAVGLLDGGPSWCNKKFDLADDNQDDIPRMATDIQCMNHVSAAVLPAPARIATATLGPEVIGVWAWQPGHTHGIADESHAWRRFLAHITDNGTRVIGFLLERIADAREAGPTDLKKCNDTLSRLHALGIAYGGPLRRHSFLVCGGDAVLIQGFGGSFRTTDKEALGSELKGLEQVLAQQPSELEKFNAPIDIELGDSKCVTLTAEQHSEMVAEL
ncbi:hypothetical protein F4678DRAFT_475913 [Xylaria arbuscula]|nr:hypothetical protein F4678DRAFT_475913 [Xylaria arbuscula]